MEKIKVIGACKHCGSKAIKAPGWQAPIWENLYCSNPNGHQIGEVYNPVIQGRNFEDERKLI